MGTESQFGKMRKCWRQWWGWLHDRLNATELCTLNSSDGQFHVFSILSQWKERGPGQAWGRVGGLTGPSLSDFRISVHSFVLLLSSLMRLLCWVVRL